MRKSIRVVVVTVLALGVALLASVPASAATLDLVGKSDLGGKGLNGEVATVGDTAIVGAGVRPGIAANSGFANPAPCPKVSTKVVDLEDPSSPRVVNAIEHPEGVAAVDVAAMKMNTPSFQGDLAAVALIACGGPGGLAERGVAYYDVTNPREPQLLGRYMADSDRVQATDPACDGKTVTRRCAASQHSVSLVNRPDGKVLSLSTSPFAASSNFDSGDLRVVDITDPKTPTQVGDFPEKASFVGPAQNNNPPGYDPDGAGPQPPQASGFSNNGCRPFDLGRQATPTGDGTKALFAFFDQGLFTLDLSNPNAPNRLGQLPYNRDDRSREGNAAYVESTTVGGRSLALMSQDDWVAPSTSLRIDGGAAEPLAGSKFACEAMFTLFDPEDDAAIYRKGGEIPGEMAYVGRGCPQGGNVTAPDPYLADPNGKIAVVDRNTVTSRQGTLPGGSVGCQAAAKVKRAQEAGARGIVVLNTSTSVPQTISFDGVSQGLNIPVIGIDTGDASQLRDAACPTVVDGACVGGRPVSGAMVDKPGAWGGLQVIDVDNPANPTQLAEYHTPAAEQFPPPDRGVYSIHHAIGGQGGLAYAAWNSAGLRVLDLAGGNPREVASFVPEDTADPSKDEANGIAASVPPKAFVVGVTETEKGQIVISDINSGLYVLSLREPEPPPPPADSCPAGTSAGVTCKPLPGGGLEITGTPGSDTIVGTDESDVIACGEGDDIVNAGAGDDVINCGAGNDRVNAGPGNDRVNGESGNDRLNGSTGDDSMIGGSGDDLLAGNEGEDTLRGDVGNDTLFGNEDDDVINGEVGNDRMAGGTGDDRAFGASGDDLAIGNEGEDTLVGNDGRDRLNGNEGNDVVNGEAGNDSIAGSSGRDRMFGGSGDDRAAGGTGEDAIRGNNGNDILAGNENDDVIGGDAGDDELFGGSGNDRLSGGPGRDRVVQ